MKKIIILFAAIFLSYQLSAKVYDIPFNYGITITSDREVLIDHNGGTVGFSCMSGTNINREILSEAISALNNCGVGAPLISCVLIPPNPPLNQIVFNVLIDFPVSANTSAETRIIRLLNHAGSPIFTITQKHSPLENQPRVYNVTPCDIIKYPKEDNVSITLIGSESDVKYELCKSEFVNSVVESKWGTGRTIIFTGPYSKGVYYIQARKKISSVDPIDPIEPVWPIRPIKPPIIKSLDFSLFPDPPVSEIATRMNGQVTITNVGSKYWPFYAGNYHDDNFWQFKGLSYDKDGFKKTIRIFYPNTVVYYHYILNEIVERYSNGSVSYWDSHFKINVTHGPVIQLNESYNYVDITVSAGPNIDNFIHTSRLNFNWQAKYIDPSFTQNSGGTFKKYNVSGQARNAGGLLISLSGSQHLVQYYLYKDGVRVNTIEGDGNALEFICVGTSATGVYTIKAEYKGYIVDMIGEYVGNNTPNHTQEHTYISADGHKHTQVKYYDPLGRLKQAVLVNASPANKDIVNFATYDCMGRVDSITYLSYVADGNRGFLRNVPLLEQRSYYANKFPGDPDVGRAYSKKVYDDSPLGLVLSSSDVGENSHKYPVNYGYQVNNVRELIRHYVLSGDAVIFKTYYPSDALTINRVWQELPGIQRTESKEYTNSLGQLVAKEVRLSDGERRFTYYVYDDFGRQRYIIPPIQNVQMNTLGATYSFEQLKKYSYHTEYDEYGNAVKQWVPGVGFSYSIYDKRGRLVMSQSPNLVAENKWAFTKYDIYDRPVLTGVHEGGDYEIHLNAVHNQNIYGEQTGGTIHGYSNNCYPNVVSVSDILSITYYDNYNWLNGISGYTFSTTDALGNTNSDGITSLATGTKTKVLGIDTDKWLTSVTYYDQDYQTIQSISDLYPGGKEIVSNKHNFVGEVVQTRVTQKSGSISYGYNKWFDFDNFGRLLQVRQQIIGDTNNGEVVIASCDYDDMGAVTAKHMHNGLETINYEYTLPGVNIAQSSSAFSYRLGFDKPVITNGEQEVLYNGNLSNIAWSNSRAVNRRYEKGYNLYYDKTGQMSAASYAEASGGSWGMNQSKYYEGGLTYDLNSNIMSLDRKAHDGQTLHDITYNYDNADNANAISSVVVNGASSDEFLYDANGNMILDGMTGVGVEYNILNLPEKIFAGGDQISYIYSAAGEKLASVAAGSSTYYRSVMVYSQAEGQPEQLLYMMHPEGTVYNEGGNYSYKYLIADHLGSTRAVLTATTDSGNNPYMEVVQTTDYYPFGLAWSLDDLNQNRYLFGGKEIQDAYLGGQLLGLYDFHARYYNPVLGRWFNVDPALQTTNPYLYCANNPMMYVDPDGEWTFLSSIISFLKTAFFDGGLDITSSSAMRSAWKQFDPTASWSTTNKAWQIDKGLFMTDSNLNFFGRIWELISRFTWQQLQTMGGYFVMGGHNLFEGVKSVGHYGGATVAQSYKEGWGAFTLGNFITGDRSIEANPTNELFRHEYGHYLQSKSSGPNYFFKYGIPSFINAIKSKKSDKPHSEYYTEVNADKRADKYFESIKPATYSRLSINYDRSVANTINIISLKKNEDVEQQGEEQKNPPNKILQPRGRHNASPDSKQQSIKK